MKYLAGLKSESTGRERVRYSPAHRKPTCSRSPARASIGLISAPRSAHKSGRYRSQPICGPLSGLFNTELIHPTCPDQLPLSCGLSCALRIKKSPTDWQGFRLSYLWRFIPRPRRHRFLSGNSPDHRRGIDHHKSIRASSPTLCRRGIRIAS